MPSVTSVQTCQTCEHAIDSGKKHNCNKWHMKAVIDGLKGLVGELTDAVKCSWVRVEYTKNSTHYACWHCDAPFVGNIVDIRDIKHEPKCLTRRLT